MKKYLINGKEYSPILMGEKGDFDEGCEKDQTCHDCGCKVGQEHTLGCDAERCPCCGEQFISCDCDVTIINSDQKAEPYDKGINYAILGKEYKFKEKENKMEEKKFEKVEAPIIGADGNVFNLMGICRTALRRAGYSDKAKEMSDRILNSHSYAEALGIMQDYIIPTDQNDSDSEM